MVNITDLVLATEQLPATIEKLLPLRFIGEKAIKMYKEKVDLIDKLGLGNEQRKETLKDGQDAGKALLMIEAKIGELLPSSREEPTGLARVHDIQRNHGKFIHSTPEGISKTILHKARQIASHPKEVEEVIKEAEEEEDIPTKHRVLQKIAQKREAEREKGKREKTETEMRGEALRYYWKLQDVINILPPYPPQDLTEHEYNGLKALALIIINRLEVFKNGKATKRLSGPSS